MRISNHNPYLYIEQCARFTSLPAICKQLKFVVDVCWPFFPIFCLSYVMPPKVTLSYKLKLEILDYAKKTSISEASRKYAVERQNIRKWKLKEALSVATRITFWYSNDFLIVVISVSVYLSFVNIFTFLSLPWFVYIYNPPPQIRTLSPGCFEKIRTRVLIPDFTVF